MRNRIRILIVAALIIAVISCCMGCDSLVRNSDDNTDIGSGDGSGGAPGDSGNNGEGGNESTTDTIYMTASGARFEIKLSGGAAADGFARMMPLTINMSEQPHEKYYYLPSNLPTSAERVGFIRAGDIMLWGDNCLVVFYESFNSPYSYTRIGHIESTAGLASALGGGSVTVQFGAR